MTSTDEMPNRIGARRDNGSRRLQSNLVANAHVPKATNNGLATGAARPLCVLVIEDDANTAQLLVRNFKDNGVRVELATNGREGLMLAATEAFDVIVVDRVLPEMDGLVLVKNLRSALIETPCLFLTCLAGIDDRVEGLEAGANDYLVKPFAFAELMARVRVLVRRPQLLHQQTTLRVADLEVDLISRRVTRADRTIDLLPREFELLELLMRNQGRVLTRRMLLERVWHFSFDPKTSVVETHISRLRAKVDRAHEPPLIRTIRGLGYSLHEPK